MNRWQSAVTVAAMCFASSFWVGTGLSESKDRILDLGTGIERNAGAADLLDIRYQIGAEWGKKPVSIDSFKELPSLERIARGTGRLRGATGFYLGRFGEAFVVATNNHVCPTASSCRGTSFALPLEKKSYTVRRMIKTWPTIDLTLLEIEVPSTEVASLASIANPFDFDLVLEPGQSLLTVGFGVAQNPKRQMVVNSDDDCRVFSQTGDYRPIADPDQLNPGQAKVWSFANGCDVSHGDSGSAMVDRETGRVIGIIWTGKVPKQAQVRDPAYLEAILATNSPDIWTELSYGVPGAQIKAHLQATASSGELNQKDSHILEAIVAGAQ